MEKVKKDNKTWYDVKGFMSTYGIKSNATVYAMCRDGRAKMDKFMGKRVFSMVCKTKAEVKHERFR